MNEKDLIFAARCCGMKDCVACPCKGSAFCREDTMADLADALEKALARAAEAEAENARWRQVCKAQDRKIDALEILVKRAKEKSEDAMLAGYAKGHGEMAQENAHLKNLLDDLLESAKPSASPFGKDRVLVQPVSGYGGPGIYILLELDGFAANEVFVFDKGHDTTEDLCKVISSTLTDMLGEARSNAAVAALKGEQANGS